MPQCILRNWKLDTRIQDLTRPGQKLQNRGRYLPYGPTVCGYVTPVSTPPSNLELGHMDYGSTENQSENISLSLTLTSEYILFDATSTVLDLR